MAFVKTVFDGPCLAKLVFNDICKNWKCEIVCCWHPKVHVLVKCVYKGQMWTFTFVSTHLFTPFSQSWICILSGTMTVRTIYLKITSLHFWYFCVCTFCPGGLSLLGQFAYLWNVIWSFQKNWIHAAAAVPSLQTISLPWCSQREVCVCHTALCTSLCGRQSLVVFGPLSQSIIVVSVDLLCYSSHIPLDQSSHSPTPIVLIHSGPSQSKASCSPLS